MSGVIAITPVQMITALESAKDKTILLQQEGFGDDTLGLTVANNGAAAGSNSGGQVFKKQPLILDSDIAVNGNKVEVPYKTGGAAMTKGVLSSFNIANGLQVLASRNYGLEWLYRNWTQDKNPSYAYRGGGSFPAAATVVAAVAMGNATPVNHTLVAIPNTIKYVVQPKVTLSANPTVNTNRLYGALTIEGTDVNGIAIDGELRWTAAEITAGTLVKQMSSWFKTITKVESVGFSAGQVAVTVEDTSTKIVYTPQDLVLVDFVSLEYIYGGLVPYTYRDLIINTINAQITRDAASVYGCGINGGIASVRANVSGGVSPTDTSAISGLSRASSEVFIGTECYVEIGGERLAITSATLDGNQGLEDSNYLNYNFWQTGKPRRRGNTRRSLQITCQVDPSKENPFENYFMQDATIPDVRFVQRSAAPGSYGQYDSQTDWVLHECEITEFPGVGGDAQQLVLRAFNNEGAPEISIESSQPSYEDKLYHYA